jgi:4-alpha-glucanotransferase
MNFPRSSGILLHPTSLPGRFGIGDLGDEAYAFADFLAASGQNLWQMLPVGPTSFGDSPYACYSAFAGNTLLVSPERLLAAGLLRREDLTETPPFPKETVDYHQVHEFKSMLLRKAFASHRATPERELSDAFAMFCLNNAAWVEDYSLFRALKDIHGGKPWHQWDAPYLHRDPTALARARAALSEEIAAQKFYQFLFFSQWFALKTHCNERGIRIIGDIPIFVAHDSADVWTNPDQFKLDHDGNPLVVAGVPPDYFSTTGQLWGNPLYNWESMRADGFLWWIERVRSTLEAFDIARIDHFRGFAAAWEIPFGDTTAEHGCWVTAPGEELFTALRDALGELPIIAEDLGVMTPDVEQLRDQFGFPGMRVLQFAFGADRENRDLPHNYHHNVVVYTGTHDNDTTVGWFNAGSRSEAGDDARQGSTRDAEQIKREREFALDYLGSSGVEINWDFIRAALSSVADTAIVPLQDVLGLGSEARMNLPNTTSGNWTWRYSSEAITDRIVARLKDLTESSGRVNRPLSD